MFVITIATRLVFILHLSFLKGLSRLKWKFVLCGKLIYKKFKNKYELCNNSYLH